VLSLLNRFRDNIRDDRFCLTIVTGKQDELREKLENCMGYPFVTEVTGYVEDMYTLMARHDVLISKPGGLIIAEALASGICPIIVSAGPGQENANANFLARNGVAFRGETSEEIVCVVKRCIKDFALVNKRKLRAKRLGTPDAARRVAKQVLILLESNNS
jgi:processive 1,2-diacylglycerol beta-glucosyltransferase